MTATVRMYGVYNADDLTPYAVCGTWAEASRIASILGPEYKSYPVEMPVWEHRGIMLGEKE